MNKEELKAIQDGIEAKIAAGVESFKTAMAADKAAKETEIKGLKDQLAEVVAKLAKIEAMPAGKGAPGKIHVFGSEKFLGRDMKHQLVDIRNKAAEKPKNFPVFADDEKAEGFAKFMIAVNNAGARNPSNEAKQYIEKITENDFVAKAAMAEGTTTTGGFLVPTEYQWDVIMLSRDKTWALQECAVVQMGTNDLRLPTETALATVNWNTEANAATESEPTVGQVQLTAKKLDAFAKVSNELLMDSYVDVAGMLANQFSYGVSLELDNQVLNGDGTKLGSGVLTAAAGFSVVFANGLGSTNFSAISGDNLSLAAESPDEMYIPGGKFVFNKLIMHYIRTLKDSQNRYIYAQPGNGVPGTIWEYPYIMSSKGPKVTAVSTAYVAFGNWKYYYIGRRVGAMMIEVDPYGFFTSSQTQYRMVTRWGGKIAQANAFCRILTAAS